MGKPVVVIADSDADYADRLAMQFLLSAGDEIELNVFTDEEKLREYLASRHQVNMLVVSEKWDALLPAGANCVRTCILCDEEPPEVTRTPQRRGVYRHMDVAAFVQKTMRLISCDALQWTTLGERVSELESSSVVAFCSPAGGAGTTVLALATAQALAERGQRVLFAEAGPFGTARYWVRNMSSVPADVWSVGDEHADALASQFRPHATERGFDYCPVITLGHQLVREYVEVLQAHVADEARAGSYDFIVVDVSGAGLPAAEAVCQLAHHVVVVTLVDSCSMFKLEEFRPFIDYHGNEACQLVCNKCPVQDAARDDVLVPSPIVFDEYPEVSLDELAHAYGMRMLASWLTDEGAGCD